MGCSRGMPRWTRRPRWRTFGFAAAALPVAVASASFARFPRTFPFSFFATPGHDEPLVLLHRVDAAP
jgi:hypothetical protein